MGNLRVGLSLLLGRSNFVKEDCQIPHKRDGWLSVFRRLRKEKGGSLGIRYVFLGAPSPKYLSTSPPEISFVGVRQSRVSW